MSKHPFKRLAVSLLALMLVLSAAPAAMAAEDPAFHMTELVATHVTLDETEFEYTGNEIQPNVTVRVEGKLLTLDKHYQLSYADNVEVGTGKVIVTGIATSGYIGTAEHPFFIREKAPEEPEFTLVEIQGTDVTIHGTQFLYTGQPIEPEITVQVGGKALTSGVDYAVEYINNLVPGTATAIVRGIATASETLGYTGEVRIDYTIQPRTEDTYPLVEITNRDVTIDGKEFVYTGQPIEPKITVTVDGVVLTEGRDYSLRYENNVSIGTGEAVINGIATATEVGGYTGEVRVKFTIVPREENNPLTEIKGTDVTIDGTKFTYTGKAIEPKVTVQVGGKTLTAGKDYSVKYVNNVEVGTASVIVSGIATAAETGGYTGEVKIDFTIQAAAAAAPSYKITKGSGHTWYQGSTGGLSFTADGKFGDFIGLTVNGHSVDDSNYSVKEGTVLYLKNSYLKQLKAGTYEIALHFGDGEAEGTFKVAAATDNPKTGDTIGVWVAIAVISAAGLAGAVYVLRKKSA